MSKTNREHTNFGMFSINPLTSLKWSNLKEWIRQKLVEHNKLHVLTEINDGNDEIESDSDDDIQL